MSDTTHRCTCADRDGRYWCLLHDPAWVDVESSATPICLQKESAQ